MEEDRLNSAKGSLLWAVFKLQWRSYAQKKKGVCWFPIDADVTQGRAASSSLEIINL